nr:hypothetical protein [Tanacetum cinerariifolium]
MPIWCRMFRQTLSGTVRNWFDDLDPKSMENFEELSQKFLEEFSQQKRYAKDPTEIHGIKRRMNEAFMHGHGHPELAQKLNDKIPKTVEAMFERVRAFIRGEAAVGSAEVARASQWDKGVTYPMQSKGQERTRGRSGPRDFQRNMGTCAPYSKRDTFTSLTKMPKEILAMKSVNFPPPPPLLGTIKKQNLNKFCDYHGDRGHNTNDGYHLKKKIEEVVASGNLTHLVKDICRGNQRNESQGQGGMKFINMVRSGLNRKRPYEMEGPKLTEEIAFPVTLWSSLTDAPIILVGTIEEYHFRRIYVDGGIISEIMYEHCFKSFDADVKSRLRKGNARLVGFSSETYHPLGLIDLRDQNEEPRSGGFDHPFDDQVLDGQRNRYNENQQRISMGMQTDKENAEFVEGSAMVSACETNTQNKGASNIAG